MELGSQLGSKPPAREDLLKIEMQAVSRGLEWDPSVVDTSEIAKTLEERAKPQFSGVSHLSTGERRVIEDLEIAAATCRQGSGQS
jgi:hypothetical protein